MLIRNYLVYAGLWFLIKLLLVEVNCQTSLINPQKRARHTATLIGKRLYILGGVSGIDDSNTNENDIIGKQFIYCDFNVSLNVRGLLWQDLTSNNIVPSHRFAASVNGGANNHTLFLYLGDPNITQPSIYTFDTIWNIPKTINENGIRRAELEGIVDDKGKMYLFGGENTQDAPITALNDMLILDTNSLIWWTGSSINAPPPRRRYGAVYLPNSKSIIYMGGLDSANNHLQINEVYLYDTVNDAWSRQDTSGNIPSNRDGLSLVLGLDAQRIILYGGHDSFNVTPPDESLYVLDLTNFKWNVPKISGDSPQSGRYWHKAHVIGKYMVISFGYAYSQSTDLDILLLDISNNDEYKWTEIFDPSAATSPTSSSPSPTTSPTSSTSSTSQQSNKNPVIIGAVVGSVGGIGLLIGIFMFYRWNKNRDKKSIIQIPPERQH